MITQTRSSFDQELKTLQESMLEMATCADIMLRNAVDALITGEPSLVDAVIHRDEVIDRFDMDIENRCLILIATQQPVARDLRVIGTALKVITDIERIGDYAVDIAKIARRLNRAGAIYRPLADIPRLGELSRAMLHNALQAFVHQDLELVHKVIRDDDEVDRLYHQIRDDLTVRMLNESTRSYLALNLLFAAKYLERVSDHVVNIAERVQFIETGILRQLTQNHRPLLEKSNVS